MKIPKHLKITREQTELTPEQLECAKNYAQEKIKLYLSTEKVNKKLVESYVMNAYKVSGTPLPKKVRWFKSPETFMRASVRASVRDSVWDSVWDSVRAYYDADGLSFYGFFSEYFEPNKIVWLQKLSESVCGCAFYEKECWLVEKPKTLERNEQGRLHSTTGKAIEWRDGYVFYFLHGVEFDEKLWKKVVDKPHIKTILTIENMEQRMAALRVVGVEKIIKAGKLLDKSARGNELYLIENVFDEPALYLKYKCPSTSRVYVSGVDPSLERKADVAMAWKFNLTPEEYEKLEVEA